MSQAVVRCSSAVPGDRAVLQCPGNAGEVRRCPEFTLERYLPITLVNWFYGGRTHHYRFPGVCDSHPRIITDHPTYLETHGTDGPDFGWWARIPGYVWDDVLVWQYSGPGYLSLTDPMDQTLMQHYVAGPFNGGGVNGVLQVGRTTSGLRTWCTWNVGIFARSCVLDGVGVTIPRYEACCTFATVTEPFACGSWLRAKRPMGILLPHPGPQPHNPYDSCSNYYSPAELIAAKVAASDLGFGTVSFDLTLGYRPSDTEMLNLTTAYLFAWLEQYPWTAWLSCRVKTELALGGNILWPGLMRCWQTYVLHRLNEAQSLVVLESEPGLWLGHVETLESCVQYAGWQTENQFCHNYRAEGNGEWVTPLGSFPLSRLYFGVG